MAVNAILWAADPARTGGVRCSVCAHYCRIAEGASGKCRMRVNQGGALYSLSSDRIAVANLDPVEKKPLFHFLPGTTTFSLGTPGCNMTCAFCQNHGLSQANPPGPGAASPFSPAAADEIVASARRSGAASISFTYNEPIISAELIAAVAPRANEAGLAAILVSNAYASGEFMETLRPVVRAANFDLKAFTDAFYRDLCGARLAPVLRTITRAASFGWWVELTTLLIPGRNDSDAELTALARWIREELGAHVPWHISRFRPVHRMTDVPATPVVSLERARAIGLAEGLRFVYTGNTPGHDGENTYCPECGEMVIRRLGYRTEAPQGAVCPRCGTPVPGVWGEA